MSTVTLNNFIIAPTTAAATAIVDTTSGVYDPSLGGFRQLPGTIELNGVLGTGKEVLIQIPVGATYGTGANELDAEWRQYYYRDEAIKLTDTNHSETSMAPSVFRVSKPATTIAAGVRFV